MRLIQFFSIAVIVASGATLTACQQSGKEALSTAPESKKSAEMPPVASASINEVQSSQSPETSVRSELDADVVANNQSGWNPVRTKEYRPYFVVSSTLKQKMDSNTFEKILMCRKGFENFEEKSHLTKNFDIVEVDEWDGSMSSISFLGEQNGKAVKVTVITRKNDNLTHALWVNDVTYAECN